MSDDNLLFGGNDDDDYNFYDSEDILNENAYENDFDFYETDFDSNAFKTPHHRREDFDSKTGEAQVFSVPPPLPLCHFDKEEVEVAGARTIAGRTIRHVEHSCRPPGVGGKDGLHNPLVCR